MTTTKGKVLVSGGSGYIAGYCILALLKDGYSVNSTLRSLDREAEVREWLSKAAAPTTLEKLTFFAADLLQSEGWDEAVAGCTYVLHVASPFPAAEPKDEHDLIKPAREGTLHVLRAAKKAGVKRVVKTSSFAAIGSAQPIPAEPFDETYWTPLDSAQATPYQKSKTIAEKAAWDFIEKEGGDMELATVCPVMVLGPVLGTDFSTSIILVKRLLAGEMPACPKLSYGVVDVRDVADLHLLAMVAPEAAGQRFLAAAPPAFSTLQMANVLRERLGKKARKAPSFEAPNFLVRLMALVDPEARLITPELGEKREPSNEKAKRVLNWSPRSPEDAIQATAESLIEHGVVKV